MWLVDVTESAASPERSAQAFEAMRKVCEALCPVRQIHNVDLPELLGEYGAMHGESLLVSVDVFLKDPLGNIRSHCSVVNSHYVVLTVEGIVNEVDIRKRVMRPWTRGYLPCPASLSVILAVPHSCRPTWLWFPQRTMQQPCTLGTRHLRNQNVNNNLATP